MCKFFIYMVRTTTIIKNFVQYSFDDILIRNKVLMTLYEKLTRSKRVLDFKDLIIHRSYRNISKLTQLCFARLKTARSRYTARPRRHNLDQGRQLLDTIGSSILTH